MREQDDSDVFHLTIPNFANTLNENPFQDWFTDIQQVLV
jgi:hypothetical protein